MSLSNGRTMANTEEGKWKKKKKNKKDMKDDED
jgi:hypothetical protein